jgi:O-antigen ligase
VGSLVASVLIAVLLSLSRGIQRKQLRAAILLGGAALLILSFALPEVIEWAGASDALSSRAGLQSYDEDRFLDIRQAFLMASQLPFGLGPASYELMENSLEAHNLFVDKLADAGWIPAVLITGFVLVPTWKSIAAFWRSRDLLMLVLASTLVGHVLMSLVINSHHWRHLLLLCACVLVMTRRAPSPSLTRPASPLAEV